MNANGTENIPFIENTTACSNVVLVAFKGYIIMQLCTEDQQND